MKTVRIDEIEPIPVVGDELQWRPVRRTLGIEAFGINAYTANAGELVVEEHDETGTGAGHHEELYVVVTGRAIFTVDAESFDAPVGTMVFLDDPKERRGARAEEDGTTVLAIGGMRGQAFRISPWEFTFAGTPAYRAKRYDEAEALPAKGSSTIRAIRRCCTTWPASKRFRATRMTRSNISGPCSSSSHGSRSTPRRTPIWSRCATILASPS